MRFQNYLNESKKQIGNLPFNEFQKVAKLEWDSEKNGYVFKYKDKQGSKKTKTSYIPINNYQEALERTHLILIKKYLDKVDLNILKQYQEYPGVQEEINKRENPLQYINNLDLASNKEIRQYVKKTEEYKDYLDFGKALSKRAQNEDEFTWNDVKQIAKKTNIEIGSSLISPTAGGEASVGSSRVNIRKKYIGTSAGVGLFFHELSHALLVTKRGEDPGSSTKKIKISNTEWLGIFDILSQSSKGTFKSSQTERYARLFQVYFTKNKQLKKTSPGLYNKISSLLEDIAIYLVIKNHGGYQYGKDLIKKNK